MGLVSQGCSLVASDGAGAAAGRGSGASQSELEPVTVAVDLRETQERAEGRGGAAEAQLGALEEEAQDATV